MKVIRKGRTIDRNGGRENEKTRRDKRKRKMSSRNGGKKEGEKKITNE
jgi:hypothetical protein